MTAKKKFIAVCTPSLGTVSIWWTRAFVNLMWPMNYGKVVFFLQDDVSTPNRNEIAENRNKLVRTALDFESDNREVSHIFWLDDDVIVPAAAVMQLLSHDRDIASGVYFTKAPGRLSEPLIFPSRVGGTDRFIPNRTYEVWGHGMGLCLVKTDVYRKMESGMDRDSYGNPEFYKTVREYTATDFGLDCGGTEDLDFLNKAAAYGYRPLVDTGAYAFGWHFDLKTNKGYPEEQFDQLRKAQTIRWDTPDGPVEWN